MSEEFMPALGLSARIENDPDKREEAIKKDIPVRFSIERDLEQYKKLNIWDDLYNIDYLGKAAVKKYDKEIVKYSQKHNLDPDIVRSVMYAENARVHKMGANYITDRIGQSGSVMPMNIQKDRWAGLVNKKPDELYNPDNNIETATVLLKRIAARVDRPAPEKVGSIWNYVGHEKTNEFGEYIGQIYRKKPWKRLD